MRRLDALEDEPRPPGCKRLAGEEDLYRIRIGDYRAPYEVDDRERVVRIARARHRREVYRGCRPGGRAGPPPPPPHSA